MTTYWRIGKSRVVHKCDITINCHYWLRAKGYFTSFDKKPRGHTVCDACQLYEKKARAAAMRKVK
jgi:hypothetical protein